MAFWNRDKASAQRHSMMEVIKYDGPNDILVWKFPNEDFNTNTKLIVGPAQEAIFVKGGRVLECLEANTYTLSTSNYPFVRALVGTVTGGVSPFSCSVYYINKVVSMGIDWGTDTPISVVDPIYRVPIDIRSYGDFSVRVTDGRKLMEKLVGQGYGFSQEEIQSFFSNMMATQIRSVISGTMLEKRLSAIGIDAHLPEMSDAARAKLQPIFEPYGMALNHFTIAAITAPDLDAIKRKALTLQAHRMETDVATEDMRKQAQAKAFEKRELNNADLPEWEAPLSRPAHAGQPAVNGSAGIAGMLLNQSEPEEAQSSYSGAVEQPGAQPAQESFEERARKVKVLLDLGMITQEQYMEKVSQLMNDI